MIQRLDLDILDVHVYRNLKGRAPFLDWRCRLDKSTQLMIDGRILRLRRGNFGDCKRLSGAKGVFELRINAGPGFRIYYGVHGDKMVILLCGGDKGSQERDIRKAIECWEDFLVNIKSME